MALQADASGTHVDIRMSGGGSYRTMTLSSPDRLVVDFPGGVAANGLRLPAAAGVVSAVRTGSPQPGVFRVVFVLADSAVVSMPRFQDVAPESHLLIDWPGAGQTATVVPAAATTPQNEVDDARREAARATAALTASVVQAASSATTPAAVLTDSDKPSPQAILDGQTVVAATPAGAGGGAPSNSAPSPAQILNGQTATVAAPPLAAETASPPTATSGKTPLPARMQPGMRALVVAVDAGHGGQDSGAIGPTGKREKDVTLAVARELARQINATPGMRAYLVRDADVFIPLPMRTQRAHEAKADIFVSIHADAADNRSASGASVFVLSTKGASSQRARWLADKENAADVIGGVSLSHTENTLANVLLDLAQSGTLKASEDAANNVLDGLKQIGNSHKQELERANFAVLRTSDMPAMLVETAFISNPEEERSLTDPAYQRRIASAVLEGVRAYFSQQPPPGTLFAARAQAEMDIAAGAVAVNGSDFKE